MRMATRSNYKFILKDWSSLEDLDAVSKVLGTKRFTSNLEPVVMDVPKAKTALIIAPHPDDDLFSSGGTMLKLKQKGCSCKVVYLATGSKETYTDEGTSVLTTIVEKIEKEARSVSGLLGTKVEFWRYPNSRIKTDGEAAEKIRDVYKSLKPDVVFLPFVADDHQDHRQGARLFYEAFKDHDGPDCEVWAYQVYSNLLPNVIIDITDQMEEKVKLMGLWETRNLSRDWAHYIKGLNAFNSRFLKTNEPRYAETFFVVPAREYIELCGIYFNRLDRKR